MSNDYINSHPTLNKKVMSASKKLWYGEFLDGLLPEKKDSKILEIGPGLGEGLSYLTDLGYQNIEAVDNCQDVIDICKNTPDVAAHYIDDIPTFLKEKNNHYDLIILSHVLEHIKKDSVIPTLNNIRNSISDEGLVIIIVPNISCSLVGVEMYFSDFTHEVAFSPRSLSQALSMSDFGDHQMYNVWPPQRSSLKRKIQYYLQRFTLILIAYAKIPFGIKNKVITHQIKAVARK